MTPCTPAWRWTARAGAAGAAALAVLWGLPAAAGAQPVWPASVAVGNPYAPAYHHAYRHGAVPTRSAASAMARWQARHSAAQRLSAKTLSYGGGTNGIGVTTGHEKVYLVFYGSQWGTKSTNSAGDVKLSGDKVGEAPRLQELFKGLGTDSERWSGVMTEYCQGVSFGAHTCPSTAPHVAYPTNGALRGVWVDESVASPSRATGHQLGVEAVKAAAHFGNKTASANRNAQYVILSPHGTHPDGFPGSGFCAWHDWNGDSGLPGGSVSSPYGPIPFTNMPYVTDAGASCGEDFVNSNGTLDGVSIVEGHEYAETITDQLPAGGWTNFGTGEENADECAWLPPGSPGGMRDLKLATGSFAMQSTWANVADSGAGGCLFTHAIVTAPAP